MFTNDMKKTLLHDTNESPWKWGVGGVVVELLTYKRRRYIQCRNYQKHVFGIMY